jgi:hypothetical protein
MADVYLKAILACLVHGGAISLEVADAIFRGGDAFIGMSPHEVRNMTIEDMVEHIEKWEVRNEPALKDSRR